MSIANNLALGRAALEIPDNALVFLTFQLLKNPGASSGEKAIDIVTSAKRSYHTLGNEVTMRSLWDSLHLKGIAF